MKIIVLHGDDTQKSYERLVKFIREAKKRGWEIVNDKIEDTQSLFGLEKLIIIRDYKILTKEKLKLIDKLQGYLVIYHQSLLPTLFLKQINPEKIEKYVLPELLWKFLDHMTLDGFHQIIAVKPIEFVFSMIGWKLKKNYLKNPNIIIAKQINELSEIDIKVKTGKINLNLALDMFILKHLS